ncbi:MAG: hypothetical protein SFW66_10750 [Gammaproteobacteria bacterium]|nr:hypothetical protein [Gammaproteobacteria bacterium]
MQFKPVYALIAGLVIGAAWISNCSAADDQATKDENTVVGACMVQKFTERTPAISEATINKCADVDSSVMPKCLGLSDDEYVGFAKFCVTQLINAKCVAAKMKTPLMQYADCGYEKDPAACYKQLGFTMDQVVKLSTDCQSEVAKK